MTNTFNRQISKVRQLADSLSLSISTHEYKEGCPLPSINQLSINHNVSRDTVFKAFKELKQKGIVDSTPTKGYFVCNAVNKVLLLLDTNSPFKYELHKALSKSMDLSVKIDLYFHNYNEELFNKIILDSVGRYNLYLIMNYQNDKYSQILDKLDHNKVLLLDFGKFEKDKFSYVCQGFDSTLYDCLNEGIQYFKKYKKIVFVFPNSSEHPKSCIPYFEQFCEDNEIPYELIPEINEDVIIKGVAYLIVSHSDLVEVLKITRKKKLALAKDVGIVVFNDEPVFEILDNGITAISTDFKKMGEVAAEYIRTRNKVQVYIPTKLIVRESL
ncbi:MAG: GntR family transcriptional regulator [Bacteroidales bacterium]|jgi:DNA-binding transcriptional regulator YhcF (GntR family)